MKIALVAWFLAVGLVLSAPLARHFADGVPYTRHPGPGAALVENVPGDHLQLYYRLWLLGDTLFGDSSPYRNRYEFSVEPGRQHPLASYFAPASLAFLIFGPLGPAAGYNAALLAAIVLGGLSMHALVLHYTGDRAAALVGGTAFAAAPYVAVAILGGHPIGLAAFFVPLSVLLLERLLVKRSLGTAAAAGAVFVLLADNDLHALYFVALLCPLVVARHFAARSPRAWLGEVRALALPLAVAAALAGGAVALKLSLLPRTESVGGPARTVREVELYAPSLPDLLRRTADSQSRYVYPGLAICLAAAVGFAAAKSRRPVPGERPLGGHALFFGAIFAGSLVLAFGPRFPIAAPYHFLYDHLPKFALLRQTSKLMLPASFALAVLAGLGWAALRRALPGGRGLVATAVVLAAIVGDASSYPGPGVGISLLPARVEAYERVFADTPGSRVVNVPIWPGNDAWSSHYLYYATRYRTVMVNGYHPILPAGYEEQVFRPLIGLNAGQLGATQHGLLRRMGVEHLILHEESFPPKVSLFPSQLTLENLRLSPYLEPEAAAAPVSIFRVRAPEAIGSREVRLASSVAGVALAAAHTGEGTSAPDAEAASGAALFVGAGPATVRLQRPRTTPAGSYTLAVSVRPGGDARFALEVRRMGDDALLAERAFAEGGTGYRTASVDFALETAAPVYYQLRNEGAPLSVDWLYLRFADHQDPPAGFELEEIFHAGNAVADERASGGAALRLDTPGGLERATRGPYRLFDAGRYVMTLSLALAGDAPQPPGAVVAAVALRNHLDEVPGERDRPANTLMAERLVTAGELGAGFRDVAFPFTLARPAFLSLGIRQPGPALLADRATVARVGP